MNNLEDWDHLLAIEADCDGEADGDGCGEGFNDTPEEWRDSTGEGEGRGDTLMFGDGYGCGDGWTGGDGGWFEW